MTNKEKEEITHLLQDGKLITNTERSHCKEIMEETKDWVMVNMTVLENTTCPFYGNVFITDKKLLKDVYLPTLLISDDGIKHTIDSLCDLPKTKQLGVLNIDKEGYNVPMPNGIHMVRRKGNRVNISKSVLNDMWLMTQFTNNELEIFVNIDIHEMPLEVKVMLTRYLETKDINDINSLKDNELFINDFYEICSDKHEQITIHEINHRIEKSSFHSKLRSDIYSRGDDRYRTYELLHISNITDGNGNVDLFFGFPYGAKNF